jgi:hypothetical protein
MPVRHSYASVVVSTTWSSLLLRSDVAREASHDQPSPMAGTMVLVGAWGEAVCLVAKAPKSSLVRYSVRLNPSLTGATPHHLSRSLRGDSTTTALLASSSRQSLFYKTVAFAFWRSAVDLCLSSSCPRVQSGYKSVFRQPPRPDCLLCCAAASSSVITSSPRACKRAQSL